MHSHYRGSQDWRDLGLPLTTGSDEACKMFDAVVTQTLGWFDDDSLGGMAGTFGRMNQADPNFVMGHVWANWLDVASQRRVMSGNDGLAEDIARTVTLSKTTPGITAREVKHAQAVDLWAHGYMDKATDVWEDILIENPLDICAIAASHTTYLYRGKGFEIRDCIARVLPHWKPSNPHYGYLLGLYGYGLEESNMLLEGEKMVQKALSINRKDAWSTHSLCHLWELMGKQEELLEMMEKTQEDWKYGRHLACHNHWHWALNNIEMGNLETAVSIFDDQLNPCLSNNGSVFNLADVTSLLYRLEMEGGQIEDRWDEISDMYKKHTNDHMWAFQDIHIFFACLKSKDSGMEKKMMESIQHFIRDGQGDTRDVMASVGEKVMRAFTAYEEGDYGEAVDLMYSVKYRIKDLGGSNAQRDLFSLFLIQAAIKSPHKKHHQLARNLVNERKALIAHAPMTDRLMAKVLEIHQD